MFENLSFKSILDPLREPALWVGALFAAGHAIEEAATGQLGWGQLFYAGVFAFGAFIVRAVVTPLRNQ